MKRIEFWLWFIVAFGLYLMAYGKLGKIADDIAVIRATITQQAKEYHNLDTVEVKNK